MKFYGYVQNAAKNSKKILTNEQYDQIVEELGKDFICYSNIRRRIDRNGYKLLNFPKLGLKNVLCTQIKKVFY